MVKEERSTNSLRNILSFLWTLIQRIAYYTNLNGVVTDINCNRLFASKTYAEGILLSDVCAGNTPVERGSLNYQKYKYNDEFWIKL